MGDWLFKNVAPLLALICVVFTLSILGVIALGNNNEKLTFAVISILSMIMSSIVGFYFGSSVGSSKKNVVIEDQLKALTPTNTCENNSTHNTFRK